MSDEKLIKVLKSLPLFSQNFLHIRSKSGSIKNFEFNRAQVYLHNRLEAQLESTGKVRALILKGRQQGCCLSPNTRVLTADYHWVRIEDLRVGEKVIACDEFSNSKTKSGRKASRKFKTAIIEAKAEFYKPILVVTLDNGAQITMTRDHRMLCKVRGGDSQQWREAANFKIGDSIRVATRPPFYANGFTGEFADGWFGGLIDGEGSWREKPAKRLSITQCEGLVLERARQYLRTLEIPFCEVIDNRKAGETSKFGSKPVTRIDIHRLPYILEILARCRPVRFVNRDWHSGHELPGKAAQQGISPWTKIVSIVDEGWSRVIDIQTSEKTFIAEGLVSHNSTYVQARYFHKVITQRGKKAFILTHEAEATKNLFDMAKRYYDSLPEGLAPKSDASNAKELNFKSLNSGYSVGTAGNKAVGRSQTLQLMHASEAAYYPHAEEHAKGIFQAVSNEPGTEIIIESTANGIGNYFYNIWMSAMTGQSDFQAIFIPWYWQTEYTGVPKESETISLTEEEQTLLETHKNDGLTKEHLYWRRRKLLEFSNDFETAKELFSVEYPMTALDAFRNPVADRFIKADLIIKARKNNVESASPLVIGVDPAITDHDRTAIIRRKGRLTYKLETHFNLNTMEIVGLIRRIIDKERPSKVCVDCIGIGQGIYDRLREIGYDCVEGVNVARSANDKDKFRNLRAELWHDMREWLAQDLPVQIPDSDELMGDLTSLGYKFDSSGRLQIESKDELRKRGMKSPDCFIAGTLINTPCGKIPIEEIKIGDYVCTPMGNQKVIKNWKTIAESLTSVVFSNDANLTGKGSHSIFTWNRGWVRMDALELTDEIESDSWLNKLKWTFLNIFHIRGKTLDFKHQVDIIRQGEKLTRSAFYTGVFGSTILEKFQHTMIFIMKMATGQTTELKTCVASNQRFTSENICLSSWLSQNLEREPLKDRRKPYLKPRNGTDLKRVLNGTNGTGNNAGKKESQSLPLAQNAPIHSILFSPRGQNIAQENAPNQAPMPSKKHFLQSALGAIKNFWRINSEMLSVAPKSVQTENVAPTSVYNLTLENENVYYANGILVANCADALALTFSVGDYLHQSEYVVNKIDARAQGMFI